jgi:hypothetical protein
LILIKFDTNGSKLMQNAQNAAWARPDGRRRGQLAGRLAVE